MVVSAARVLRFSVSHAKSISASRCAGTEHRRVQPVALLAVRDELGRQVPRAVIADQPRRARARNWLPTRPAICRRTSLNCLLQLRQCRPAGF